jgi:hypothetical protein
VYILLVLHSVPVTSMAKCMYLAPKNNFLHIVLPMNLKMCVCQLSALLLKLYNVVKPQIPTGRLTFRKLDEIYRPPYKGCLWVMPTYFLTDPTMFSIL